MTAADQRHVSGAPDRRKGEQVCLALDVGGSSVTGAVVDRGGGLRCVAESALDSHAPAAAVVARLADELARLEACRASALAGGAAAAGVLAGVALAVPGPFDEERGAFLIRGLPKFEQLYGVELGPLLRESLPWLAGLRIVYLNDAAAFALGEQRHGAAAGAGRVLALTLGTGCGSAFLVGGEIVTSGHGVPQDGHVYHLPFEDGTVDDALSTRGVARLWAEASPLALAAGAPSVAELASWARGGDSAAILTFRRFGARLADALGPVINAFAPDVVVLGGNIARAFDLFGKAAAGALAAAGINTRLESARDIGGAALKGAAARLWQLEPEVEA